MKEHERKTKAREEKRQVSKRKSEEKKALREQEFVEPKGEEQSKKRKKGHPDSDKVDVEALKMKLKKSKVCGVCRGTRV